MKLLYRNAGLLVAFVIVVSVFAYYEHGGVRAPAVMEKEETPRPDFEFNDLTTGQKVPASAWDGQVVLFNFWAAWCPPCRREIPGFNEVRELYHDDGFEVVGIAVDEREPVVDFLEELGDITYPQLIQTDAAHGMRVMRQFGNESGGLPYSVLVDRRRMMKYVKAGELDKGVLLKELDKLLTGQ